MVFNDVLNDVYDDHVASALASSAPSVPLKLDEPSFVQTLVSAYSIARLNWAAARCYDFRANAVYFRGGFLHARPCAAFHAHGSTPAAGKDCLRELADALFVVYVTAPDPQSGAHVVQTRSACMLMFKRSKARMRPSTPRFQPGIDNLPQDDGDKEQFYLFNRWPAFDLHLGNKRTAPNAGWFALNAPSRDIGKYALVWDYNHKTSGWGVGAATGHPQLACWLQADPWPRERIRLDSGQASLGYLLAELGDGTAGRPFLPSAPTPATNGWDELMGFLLGYYSAGPSGVWIDGHLEVDTWGNVPRDANPAAIQFLGGIGEGMERMALLEGHAYQSQRNRLIHTGTNGLRLHAAISDWMRYRYWQDYPYVRVGHRQAGDRLPVLIATVHRSTPVGSEYRRG